MQAADHPGQGVVVAVTFTAHRWLDVRCGQSFAVLGGHLLRSTVAVVDQSIGMLGRAGVQGLLQRIENEVRARGVALPPADDPASADVHHKGYVLAALPG